MRWPVIYSYPTLLYRWLGHDIVATRAERQVWTEMYLRGGYRPRARSISHFPVQSLPQRSWCGDISTKRTVTAHTLRMIAWTKGQPRVCARHAQFEVMDIATEIAKDDTLRRSKSCSQRVRILSTKIPDFYVFQLGCDGGQNVSNFRTLKVRHRFRLLWASRQ